MSIIQDVYFAGQAGQQLAGKLHLPQGSYRGAAIFAHDIAAGSYLMRADEPASVPGGLDSGPPPYDFLLAGLGACTAMTLRLYARQKGWPLEDVDVQLRHKKDYLEDNKQAGKLDFIDRTITLTGPLDAEMRTRLLQIADKCPVHKSLEAGIKISTSLS